METQKRIKSIEHLAKWDRFREKRGDFIDYYCQWKKKEKIIKFWEVNILLRQLITHVYNNKEIIKERKWHKFRLFMVTLRIKNKMKEILVQYGPNTDVIHQKRMQKVFSLSAMAHFNNCQEKSYHLIKLFLAHSKDQRFIKGKHLEYYFRT